MIALWKLKYIGRPKIRYYLVDDQVLKVRKGRKYSMVYLNSCLIFTNVLKKKSFKKWWKEYLREKGKKNVIRLKRSEGSLLLYSNVMNKKLSKKEISIWKRL